MPKSPPKSISDGQAAKSAKAVERAIAKGDLAKQSPTVGKPVIIDPPDESKPPIKDPEKSMPE